MILQVSPDRPDTQMADFFENVDDSNDSILNVCITFEYGPSMMYTRAKNVWCG